MSMFKKFVLGILVVGSLVSGSAQKLFNLADGAVARDGAKSGKEGGSGATCG